VISIKHTSQGCYSRAVARIFFQPRQNRLSAEGARIEAPRGVGSGEGACPLPSRLGGLGERREFPQRGSGRSPGRQRFWWISSMKERCWLHFKCIIPTTCRRLFYVTSGSVDITISSQHNCKHDVFSKKLSEFRSIILKHLRQSANETLPSKVISSKH